MTMPDERTRNLLQAGAFLRELEADTELPDRVRWEAHRLLRHYPTLGNVKLLAEIEQRWMGSNILTTEIDPAWWEGYRFGVHTEMQSPGDLDHPYPPPVRSVSKRRKGDPSRSTPRRRKP